MKTLYTSPFTALALSVSMTLAAATVLSAQTRNIDHGMGASVASTTVLRQGDAYTGVLPHTQSIHIVVALKLRNHDRLDSLLAAHQTLTSAQFSTLHAPTPLQAQKVATYLTQMGFTNVVIAPNRLLVSADGTAGAAQAAFQTSFARVQTHDGRVAFANNSDAHVPVTLQDSVLSVTGLQNVHMAHTSTTRAQLNLAAPKPNATIDLPGFNPLYFSSIYGGTGVPTAAGVTVGIVTEGDMTQSLVDLGLFTSSNGLAPVTTQVVITNGTSIDTSNNAEWSLDTQDVVGAGGGQVGRLILYTIPNLSNVNMVADFNTVVVANAAKVINVSIGECEIYAQSDGSAAAADQIFQAAIAQGQTFSFSAGDNGSDECDNGGVVPEWPASSPFVISAGGTTLKASSTTWLGEVVWNELAIGYDATGGSPSTFEPKPSWQSALVPGSKRGVPDYAFDGDPLSGALIYVNGGIQEWGGTSLASPIFVGFWARVIAVKGTSIGFAAPWLYQLPASDFHDVTAGSNPGETAKVGYDFASGRGSMILNSAIKHIGITPPLNVNFSQAASGLTIKFNDSSTDSASTITAHAWSFGDGGTSTVTSPSHTYAAGTYNVTEIVTDQAGWTLAKSMSVTVTGRR
ncbi:protease pro-enzyme activation domain-containing protein [Rhodanobacter sp. L36]|uniref:protease pro-enzyme activation domain-containing protein n=1 Tax=Rhodanobacter sp. L36 TaxID=1747221 RepID=UPI0020B1771D|nr:protease pro-enzyme activation domain-containing protein [Rhodanobacter sp. L36]